MRTNQWIISLFLATALLSSSAMAAETPVVPEKSQSKQTLKLEQISDTPATTARDEKDCPMNQGKKDCPMHQAQKECNHKKGETCPYHQDVKQHGKMQDKCEHKHPG